MGRKVENCTYKINTPMTSEVEKEAGKSQEVVGQKPSEEALDAFGPQVLVARKWQPNKKLLKDKVQPSPLGPFNQSPSSQAVPSPRRPTVGSVKVGENSFGGNQKPIFNLEFSVKRTDHSVKPKTSSKPTPGVKMMGAKGSELGPKSTYHRKKYREASGRKETNKNTIPFWKEVVANPFGTSTECGSKLSSLSSSSSDMRDFREFKARGSTTTMEKAASSCTNVEELNMVDGDAQGNQMVDSFMMVDKSIVGAEVPLISCMVRRPPMEIPNQLVSDEGLAASTESILANISNCPWKRIDPTIQLGRVGKENEEAQTGDELSRDPIEKPEVPAEDMQFDEGGTAPNSS